MVYVGTVNNLHKDIVLAALNAGKHVLCEKPMGINYKEVKSMVDAARANKVFFMEVISNCIFINIKPDSKSTQFQAIWTRFFPAIKELHKRVKNGDIGDPKIISATFSNANIHSVIINNRRVFY